MYVERADCKSLIRSYIDSTSIDLILMEPNKDGSTSFNQEQKSQASQEREDRKREETIEPQKGSGGSGNKRNRAKATERLHRTGREITERKRAT